MRRLLSTIALVAVCGYSLSAWAQTFTTPSDAARRPGATPAGATVPIRNAPAALLAKRVESVDWVEVTFEEVIDWLKDQGEGQVNIVPRWTHLNIEDVTREAFVTLQLNNTTVAEVLDETLDQLSEEGQLRYRAERTTLRISTKTDFERKLEVRVYDVADILFKIPNFGEGAPEIDLQRTNRQQSGGGGGGGSSQGVFGGGRGGGQSRQLLSQREGEGESEESLEKLRDLIMAVIAPDSWEETGGVPGRGGRIEVFNRALVIRNTIEVHEQIAGKFLGE